VVVALVVLVQAGAALVERTLGLAVETAALVLQEDKSLL
jgi:hypothetical protein